MSCSVDGDAATDVPPVRIRVFESTLIPVSHCHVQKVLSDSKGLAQCSEWCPAVVEECAQESVHLPLSTIGSEVSLFLRSWDEQVEENEGEEEEREEEEAKERIGVRSSPTGERFCLLLQLAATEVEEEGGRTFSWRYTLQPLHSPSKLSPFPGHVHNLELTLTIHDVTSDPHACYASLSATFAALPLDVDPDTIDTRNFLRNSLLKPMLACLAEYSIVSRYDVPAAVEDVYHAQYRLFERQFCDVNIACPSPRGTGTTDSVDNGEPPQPEVLARDAFQDVFVSWIALARRLRRAEGLLKEFQDFYGADAPAAADEVEGVHEGKKEENMKDRRRSSVAKNASREGPDVTEDSSLVEPKARRQQELGYAVFDHIGGVQPGELTTTTAATAERSPTSESNDVTTKTFPLDESAAVSGATLSDRQIKELYAALDFERKGEVPKDRVEQFYLRMVGPLHGGTEQEDSATKQWLDMWMKRYTRQGSDCVSYEEFSILALMLAKR